MFCGKMLHVKKPFALLLRFLPELHSQQGVRQGGGEDQEKCEHVKECQGNRRRGVCGRTTGRQDGVRTLTVLSLFTKGPRYRSLWSEPLMVFLFFLNPGGDFEI